MEEEERHEIMRCRHENDCKCGSCNSETGLCESFCAKDELCTIDYNNPRNRVCCPIDYVAGNYCCSFVSPEGKCCDKNGTCCSEDKPVIDKWGGCHSCEDKSSFQMANTKLCTDLCENRILEGSYYHLQCESGTFVSKTGGCTSCTNPATHHDSKNETTAANCSACTNRS